MPRARKPLPLLPSRIGHHHLTQGRCRPRRRPASLRAAFRMCNLTVYPVRVQGEGSAEEIVKALKFFKCQENCGPF